MKIALIIPFFGKKPPYLDLFLDTLKRNPSITVLFYSDIEFSQNEKEHLPDNFILINFSLGQFNFLATEKIGFKINLSNSKKLAEFKPAFGKIFEEDIREYPYWAFGDIDLIYGNVQKFLYELEFEKYDVLSLRSEYISGALTILKNSEFVINLYAESKDYQKVFKDNNEFYSFTECNKKWAELKKDGNNVFNVDTEIEHFTLTVLLATRQSKIQSKFTTKIKESIDEGEYVILKQSGVFSSNGTEFLLYHYITEKRKPYFTYFNSKIIPDTLFIDRTGFFKEQDFTKLKYLRQRRKLSSLPAQMFSFLSRIKKKVFH